MKYVKRTYQCDGQRKWKVTEEGVEEVNPLTTAVENMAAAFPGQVIVGTSINDVVVHVAPLDPQPKWD